MFSCAPVTGKRIVICLLLPDRYRVASRRQHQVRDTCAVCAGCGGVAPVTASAPNSFYLTWPQRRPTTNALVHADDWGVVGAGKRTDVGDRPLIAESYLIGWRAGQRALRTADITVLGEMITAEEIEALAATEARLFMEERMEQYNLTWRVGVHHFFSFFEGYQDGARLRVTMQQARFDALRRNGHGTGKRHASDSLFGA